MIYKIPDVDLLVDRQFFQVPVADGVLVGWQYDKETRSLYSRESQVVIPSLHGMTHVSEDPIPDATCDQPGLMSRDDKCKLEAMTQTRIGVLGFQGAGFADDGGFLVNDIILASGSEFISLERVGNVIRFTVDSPLPLNCCEECAKIFWIQDESEPHAIRAPSCNGIMPGISGYGELKIYCYPEDVIFDTNNPMEFFDRKSIVPAFIFKRYDSGTTDYEAQVEMVLKRRADHTSQVGWSMTPGSLGIAECRWATGIDKNGKQQTFEFSSQLEPGLLGSVLANGHLLTKQMAVIINVDPNVLTNNIYVCKLWDVQNHVVVGEEFNATNVWKYLNPENSVNLVTNPQRLVHDGAVSVLQIGTLIDIWQFEVVRNSTGRIVRSYFSKEPQLNPESLWCLTGAIQFGDLHSAKDEFNVSSGSTGGTVEVSDERLLERGEWGLNNFEERLLLSDDGSEVEASDGTIQREPSGNPINNDVIADSDPTIPGLIVRKQPKALFGDINGDGVVDDEDLKIFLCAYNSTIFDIRYVPAADFNADGRIDIRDLAILGQQFDLNLAKICDRPVFLWHRQNFKNVMVNMKLGMPRPNMGNYPPFDLLLGAPVDSFDDVYLKIIKRGVVTTGPFAGLPFVVCKGHFWRDVPGKGVLRILTGAYRNVIWNYHYKTAFSNWDDDAVMLISSGSEVFPFDEDFPIGDLNECTVDHSGSDTSDVTAITEVEAVEVPSNSTVVELLRRDFTAPCIRFQFSVNDVSMAQSVQMRVRVGILDMSVPYELDQSGESDDMVRGFQSGSTISQNYLQNGFILDGAGVDVASSPEAFRVFYGGELDIPSGIGEIEKWNEVTVMLKDYAVWVWWNGLLISPNLRESADQLSPVAVNTPYFPIPRPIEYGKVGLRMFPGAVVRSMDVRSQISGFTEYSMGQLQLIS